jgi:starvation-inducible outer membrane lipoprotein
MQKLAFLCSLCCILAACATNPDPVQLAETDSTKCKEEAPVTGSNVRRTVACGTKTALSPEAAQQQLREMAEERERLTRPVSKPGQ